MLALVFFREVDDEVAADFDDGATEVVGLIGQGVNDHSGNELCLLWSHIPHYPVA